MKPILFTTEMVRAVLEGKKMQTRRTIKKQPPIEMDSKANFCRMPMPWEDYNICYFESLKQNPYKRIRWWEGKEKIRKEDILYVRETWKALDVDFELLSIWVQYQADKSCKRIKFKYDRFHKFRKYCDKIGKQANIFMPKESARIFLKVTDVRVEKIQDITFSGAIAEGIECTELYHDLLDECSSAGLGTGDLPVLAFAELWDKLYSSWDENPWVWVIEFEQTEKPN